VAHFAWARPAWREQAELVTQASALRAEKDELRGRLAALERAEVLSARAARMEAPAGTNDDAVARLRRSLLESLRGEHVSSVRLEVTPARPPLAAEGRLRAEGSFAEVVRFSGHLVRPGAGFVLKGVRLARTPHGSVALEVEGMSVAAGAP
jgi:hypothetical protein